MLRQKLIQELGSAIIAFDTDLQKVKNLRKAIIRLHGVWAIANEMKMEGIPEEEVINDIMAPVLVGQINYRKQEKLLEMLEAIEVYDSEHYCFPTDDEWRAIQDRYKDQIRDAHEDIEESKTIILWKMELLDEILTTAKREFPKQFEKHLGFNKNDFPGLVFIQRVLKNHQQLLEKEPQTEAKAEIWKFNERLLAHFANSALENELNA